MGTVTRLIPRSPEGVRFNIEHDYRKLAEEGWVPKTKSWPKMQRELRYLQTALLAQQMLDAAEASGLPLDEWFVRVFDTTRVWVLPDDPDDAA